MRKIVFLLLATAATGQLEEVQYWEWKLRRDQAKYVADFNEFWGKYEPNIHPANGQKRWRSIEKRFDELKADMRHLGY